MKLAAIRLPGDVAPWTALGFSAAGTSLRFSNGALELGHDRPAIAVEPDAAVSHDGDRLLAASSVDGIAVVPGTVEAAAPHPNGASELDHVVVMTPSLERTSAAVAEQLGLEQRRVRETPTVRQAFHRFDDHDGTRGCIVEIVERADADGASIWGVVVIVDDLDAAVAAAPDLVGTPRDAVQPGRRIATVSRSAGLSTAVALMSR